LRPSGTRSGRRETEVRLPKAADVVDLGIAHDGYPPTVAAYAGKRAVADGKAGSAPRQIENLRLVAAGMDRLIVTMEGEAILNHVRIEHAGGRPPAKRHRTSSN
jgi:hypothetical protein